MHKKLMWLALTTMMLTLTVASYAAADDIHKVTVSRGEFAYQQFGNPQGFPVIMLHGWPENSYCWKDVAANMDPSLRIIALDLRGLGESNRALDVNLYQKSELAKDVIEVINALGIQSFNIVGHDWGGVVAQEVAIAIPSRVNHMVIMNIHIIVNLLNNITARDKLYSTGNNAAWYQMFQRRPNNLAEAMIPGNERPWISQFFLNRPIPSGNINKYVESYEEQNTPATGASYYRTSDLDGQRWYQLFLLYAGYVDGTTRKFPMPTLYIYGNLDSVVIPEYLTGIEAWFDSIQVAQIEAAHFVQEEKPAEVAQLLNNFFMAP